MHWATELIGKPWVFGAKGPDAFDCWGLARYVQSRQYGIEMAELGYGYTDWRASAIAVEKTEERQHWRIIKEPTEGDLILMARNKLPVHIGIWIRANREWGALHCIEGVGVTFNRAGILSVMGWGGMQFFRHESKCMN